MADSPIGLIVIFIGLRVVRETVLQLMDTMPDDRADGEIRAAAMRVRAPWAIEKCFARKTGLRYHVDLHLEVDPDLTVRESHEIATAVRDRHERTGWTGWKTCWSTWSPTAPGAGQSSRTIKKQINGKSRHRPHAFRNSRPDGNRRGRFVPHPQLSQRGAVIEGYPGAALYHLEGPRKKVTDIPGIGKGIAAVIQEIEERGSFERRDEMLAKYPPTRWTC